MTDFRDLVEKLNILSESAPDTLGAMEKARDISPVLGSDKDPDHPFDGKLVGEAVGDSAESIWNLCDELDCPQHPVFDELVRYLSGDQIEDFVADYRRHNDMNLPADNDMYEDVLGDLEQKIGDVLKDVADSLKNDDDLKDKLDTDNSDTIGPVVKTVKTDDGHELKIHGNEDDGFHITIKNKPSKSKFESLDEASMACEMYCARRK